jgi:PadR family transcriptional regulator, regulatory protein PadR
LSWHLIEYGRVSYVTRKERRLSEHAARVLRLLLDQPEADFYGLEIIRLAEIASGSLYPLLRRFEERGLIVGAWEELEIAAIERRRPRRFYRLNPDAIDRAKTALAETQEAGPRRRPQTALRARNA